MIGRYVLEPCVFEELEKGVRGAGGEIQLTDAIAASLDRTTLHGLRFEGRRFDCGDKVGFLEANIALALDRADIGPQVRAALSALLT